MFGRRWKFPVSFAVAGLVVAAAFFAYFETDPTPTSRSALWVGAFSMVLCPPSLLFVKAIDIEPQTSGFVKTWLLIGSLNAVIYGGIGTVLSFALRARQRGVAGQRE